MKRLLILTLTFINLFVLSGGLAIAQTNIPDERQEYLERRDAEILTERPNTPSDSTQTPTNSPTPNALNSFGTSAPQNTPHTASVILTHANKSKLLSSEPNVSFSANVQPQANELSVRVDPTKTFQTMDGFGAALTDSSAWLIHNELNPNQRDALLNNLFTSVGAKLNMLRVPMGSSDFARNLYTYNDLPNPTDSDVPQNNFSIAHDLAYITPLINQIEQKNAATKTLMVPWSAPRWMKTQVPFENLPLSFGRLNPTYYGSYATYFKKTVDSYTYVGIAPYAVSPQNEPKSGALRPSMLMNETEQINFVKDHLGPTMNNTFANPKIFAFDHNWDTPEYPLTVLGNAEARGHIDGTAYHCYKGEATKQLLIATAYPTKEIHFTECTGSANDDINFGPDFRWGMHNVMMNSVRNYARSVMYWNLALDENNGPFISPGGCATCRGIVTINTSDGAVTYNTEYYILGHFGKVVQPGAQRVDSTTYGEGAIETVAFKNPDDSRALIAINSGETARTFTVREGNHAFRYTLPAGSAASFKWDMPVNIVRDVDSGRIEAENHTSVSGSAQNEFIGDQSQYDYAVNVADNTVLGYQNLQFDGNRASFQLRYKTRATNVTGSVQYRLGSPTGQVLATTQLVSSSSYQTSPVAFDSNVTLTPGSHTIYLVVNITNNGGSSLPLSLNWFKYAATPFGGPELSKAPMRAYGTHAPADGYPVNALDANTNTRWTVNNPQTLGHTFVVDLGKQTAIKSLIGYSANGDYARNLKVEVSDDGLNYTTVKDPVTVAADLYTIPLDNPVITRFVRLTATNQTAIGNWWSINELNFYYN